MKTVRGAPEQLDGYMARFAASLKPLSQAERDEILAETRSHVFDRAQRFSGNGVQRALAELGSPEEYAERFLADEQIVTKEVDTTIGRIVRLANRWETVPLLLLVAAAYAFAFMMVLIAVWKLIFPAHVGLWVTYEENRYQLDLLLWREAGGSGDGREVLSYSLVVILFSIALMIHVAVSGSLKRLSRHLFQAP